MAASRNVRLLSGDRLYQSEYNEDGAPHAEGVALLLAPEAQRSVICWEPVNLKIISAQFATRSENIKRIIIQDYTLTNDAIEGKKSQPAAGGSGQWGRCHYFCPMTISELTTTARKT